MFLAHAMKLLHYAAAFVCITGLLPSLHLAQANTLADLVPFEWPASSPEVKTSFELVVENDTFLNKKSDGFFTSGLRYTRHTITHQSERSLDIGFHVGQEMYTPSRTQKKALSLSTLDHPYAAWLYVGANKSAYLMDGSFQVLGLDVGCLGPCAGGEWLQRTAHKIRGSNPPKGWSSQVKTEFGLILAGDYGFARTALQPWLDVQPGVKGRFGNIHTDATAFVRVRLGKLNDLPDQATLHTFWATEMRAVGHDASLEGGYFSSGNPHVVAPRPLVMRMELGLAWTKMPFSIRASIVHRDNEISQLAPSAGAQRFGKIQVVYSL